MTSMGGDVGDGVRRGVESLYKSTLREGSDFYRRFCLRWRLNGMTMASGPETGFTGLPIGFREVSTTP